MADESEKIQGIWEKTKELNGLISEVSIDYGITVEIEVLERQIVGLPKPVPLIITRMYKYQLIAPSTSNRP